MSDDMDESLKIIDDAVRDAVLESLRKRYANGALCSEFDFICGAGCVIEALGHSAPADWVWTLMGNGSVLSERDECLESEREKQEATVPIEVCAWCSDKVPTKAQVCIGNGWFKLTQAWPDEAGMAEPGLRKREHKGITVMVCSECYEWEEEDDEC